MKTAAVLVLTMLALLSTSSRHADDVRSGGCPQTVTSIMVNGHDIYIVGSESSGWRVVAFEYTYDATATSLSEALQPAIDIASGS